MKITCIIVVFLLVLSCSPKKDFVFSDDEKNILEIIDVKNFNSEIIEKSDPDTSFFRFKQNLREADEIINMLKNYYTLINPDGTIEINNSFTYPYIENTKIVDYDHVSKQYSGACVDVHEFTILLENSQEINVRIFSPYKSLYLSASDLLYSSNNNYQTTKGYYEFGNALDSIKNNKLKTVINKANIEIEVSSDIYLNNCHRYLKFGPVSKYYNDVPDIYEYFLFDLYSEKDTVELELYTDKIINLVKIKEIW